MSSGRAAMVLVAVGFVLATDPAISQSSTPEIARGRELAERLCANCHIVNADPAVRANPDVPGFPAIAGRSDATAERLAGRIIIPHPAMPGVQLTVAEIRDVVAYILSLKPTK
jgi:cytochrome c